MQKKISHYLDWSRVERNGIWRYILLLVIGYLLMMLGSILVIPLIGKLGDLGDYSVISSHLSHIISFLLIVIMYHWLFGRPGYALLSAFNKIRWKDFGFGIVVALLVLGITSLISYLQGEVSFQGWNQAWEHNVILLLLLLIGLVFQTGMEELYFRGLFMQGTYRIVRWMPAVLVLQALIFGYLHIGNVAAWGGNYLAAIPYFMMALGFAYAAWRSGSLYLSWGIHFGNNAFLTFLVNTKGDVAVVSGLFLRETPSLISNIIFSVVSFVVIVIFVEFYARNRYQNRSFYTLVEKSDGAV